MEVMNKRRKEFEVAKHMRNLSTQIKGTFKEEVIKQNKAMRDQVRQSHNKR